jgi:hypothetical protein
MSIAVARKKLEEFYDLVIARGASDATKHFLQEARARLRDQQWLEQRIGELDKLLEQEGRAGNKNLPNNARVLLVFTEGDGKDANWRAEHPAQTSDQCRMLVEGYYNSAHRVRDLLSDVFKTLKLQKVKAMGVTIVRNHLITHPDDNGGVPVFSVKTGGPVGPQVRPVRWSNIRTRPVAKTRGSTPTRQSSTARSVRRLPPQ